MIGVVPAKRSKTRSDKENAEHREDDFSALLQASSTVRYAYLSETR